MIVNFTENEINDNVNVGETAHVAVGMQPGPRPGPTPALHISDECVTFAWAHVQQAAMAPWHTFYEKLEVHTVCMGLVTITGILFHIRTLSNVKCN